MGKNRNKMYHFSTHNIFHLLSLYGGASEENISIRLQRGVYDFSTHHVSRGQRPREARMRPLDPSPFNSAGVYIHVICAVSQYTRAFALAELRLGNATLFKHHLKIKSCICVGKR